LFYKQFWDTVGQDVVEKPLSILNDGDDPTTMNKTHIVLIAKVKNPSHAIELRPIYFM